MKKLLIIFFLIIIIITTSISANISVRLDRLYCISSGETVELPILLENQYPSYQLGGFDFLIEHDSRLTFLQATPGALLANCGWEYFSYSSPSPNTIRVVALAETNNGPNHPSCFADFSGTLALLRFQLGTSATFTDEFIPVWWSWADCGDNSLSSQDGNELFISDSVFYFDGTADINITQEASFESPYGAPSECVLGSAPTPIRKIDFYSGGFDVSTTGFQVNCPSDITASNDNGECGVIINFTIPLNSQCSGIEANSSPQSGSFFPLGTTVVTTVVSDNLGHIDICNFNISVEDKEPPQFIDIQGDTTLYTVPGEWWTTLNYSFSAIDFCSDVTLSSSHPSGSFFSIGITDVYCIATDSSGNADTSVFSVTVIDNEPPLIECPDTIRIFTEENTCGATANFSISASDNSMQVFVNSTVASGSFFSLGTTMVTATASDPYGNSDSCNFAIIVIDNEPPQINCPSEILIANDIGSCGAIVDFSVTTSDNCSESIVDYSQDPGSFFPIGSTLVIVSATDGSLNVDSCQFYLIVEDMEPPQITAPSDLILQNDFNQCGAIVEYSYIAIDNCDGFIINASAESGSYFEVGSTLVILQITDIIGQMDTDSFTIVIEDSEPPLIEHIEAMSVMSDSGIYGAYVDYTPFISDNCQLNLTTIDPPSGSYFELGEHEVIVKALDIHDNFDSILFIVNVILQDVDNDLIADFEDNCLDTYNPDQQDANSDGIGDACCCRGIRGNVNGSPEFPPSDNGIDISDLVTLVTFMFNTNSNLELSCPDESDVDASGELDISDLVYLIAFMFQDPNQTPTTCQ